MITDTDPIDDSPAVPGLDMTQKPPRHVRSQPRGTYGRKVLLGAYRIKNDDPRKARSYASFRHKTKLGVEALADGFEGLEITLPPKTPRTTSKRKREVARPGRKVPTMTQSLQLAGGVLPEPLPLPPIPIRSSRMESGVDVSQLQFINSSLPIVPVPTAVPSVEVAQSKPHDTTARGTPVGKRSHANHSLTTQFSRVTAPAREESDSDAQSCGSDHELDDGLDQYGAGDECEDTGSPSSESESGPMASYHVREGSGYFQEAMSHLGSMENEFWTHYGGLD